MNLNKFTEKAQEAILQSQRMAEEYSHSEILPSHLLLALLRQEGGVVPQIAHHLSVNPEAIAQALETELVGAAKVYGGSQPGISRALNNVLRDAEKTAEKMKDDYVSTEHLLLALTDSDGPAAELLHRFGLTRDAVLQALTRIRGSQRVTSQNPEGTYEALLKYGRDLTDLARKGKLDPVIGRDDEIRRVVQVLGLQAGDDLPGEGHRRLRVARQQRCHDLSRQVVGADSDHPPFLHPHGAPHGVHDHAGRTHGNLPTRTGIGPDATGHP